MNFRGVGVSNEDACEVWTIRVLEYLSTVRGFHVYGRPVVGDSLTASLAAPVIPAPFAR